MFFTSPEVLDSFLLHPSFSRLPLLPPLPLSPHPPCTVSLASVYKCLYLRGGAWDTAGGWWSLLGLGGLRDAREWIWASSVQIMCSVCWALTSTQQFLLELYCISRLTCRALTLTTVDSDNQILNLYVNYIILNVKPILCSVINSLGSDTLFLYRLLNSISWQLFYFSMNVFYFMNNFDRTFLITVFSGFGIESFLTSQELEEYAKI